MLQIFKVKVGTALLINEHIDVVFGLHVDHTKAHRTKKKQGKKIEHKFTWLYNK